MTFTTGASWWPTLKALLAPQTAPPAVGAVTDTDAGNSLRFIWGDRDAVTGATEAGHKYCNSSGTSCQKLGDVFHSGPLIVGSPSDFALFKTDTQGYRTFVSTFSHRRRVLYVGANDGLLHAFEAGVWDRDPTVCPTGDCYDLGTGAELFAFAPRAIMQIYKPLKDAVGPQTKQDEWTVDLSPSAADVFIDTGHSGTPVPGNRAWHTVLVGGVREGSPFEGSSGASPSDSRGSYYALDITQPDELVGGVEATGTFNAPKCLNVSGDASCARDWPTVLWEITDTGDKDASGSPGFGYPDMGETWAKASMGRVKVCTSACGTSSSVNEDHYVAIFGGGFDRERLNRRGNWLSMVDIETGKTLYKANSSCGVNAVSGCTPTYFGSIPSEPAAIDYNGDGYLDLIYVGDLKGQLWRIDLTDLRKLSSPPGGRFNNQLDLVAGSGKPFLLFQAPQPTAPATTPFRPIYFRPEAINLGYNSGGRPALGIAFGTGDRDDILATLDTSSLTYKQRFYYIVDAANSTTTFESTSGMLDIASPTAPAATSVPATGWFLEFSNGERVVGDSLTAGGIIRFPTFNPVNTASAGDACANVSKCTSAGGLSRQYSVLYATGNAYLGATDRGQNQPNATFITGETGYLSDTGPQGIYWAGGVQNQSLGIGRKITVRSWKEKASQP
jgi:Tfp pilus tip-associated adhesin PilY1